MERQPGAVGGPSTTNGRVAVITGGAGGIGREFAARLASDGFDIAVLDVVDAAGTVAEVEAAGRRCLAEACDITESEAVRTGAEAIQGTLGRPTVLVHVAGVGWATPFMEMSEHEWRTVVEVNFMSMFALTQAFLPAMVENAWGRIVSVASAAFFDGLPTLSHYIASKGALIGFTRSLAAEVGGHGVTVNAIAPGLIETARTKAEFPEEWFAGIVAKQALNRVGTPADLSGAVSFLVSDDASFITGQTLVVDGGGVRN